MELLNLHIFLLKKVMSPQLIKTTISFFDTYSSNIQLTWVRSSIFSLTLLHLACTPPNPDGESQFETQQIEEQADMRIFKAGEVEFTRSPNGVWAHWSEVSTCVDIGQSIEQINRTLYRVEIEATPQGTLRETWQACQIELTPVISVQAQVPEPLRQSVYPFEHRSAQQIGLPPDVTYLSGPVIETWGVELNDSLLDEMPTELDDERIYDQDQDEKPGVTLQIGQACEAYMLQRRITRYVGQFTQGDQIEGRAYSTTEQKILDASSPLCKTAYQTRSNMERSRFTRIRVDGQAGSLNLDLDEDGEVKCTEILSASLFSDLVIDHDQCVLPTE